MAVARRYTARVMTSSAPVIPAADDPDLSVVLPVYFNEANLESTFAGLLERVVRARPERRCEIVFVDDGSGDRSLEVLLKLRERHPGLVKVIALTRNFGQVSAIRAGLAHARGRFVVAMSADGQDPVELVDEMYRAHTEEGCEVVIGTRAARAESAYRVLTSRLFYWMMRKLSFPEMPPGGFDFASLSRRAVDLLLSIEEAHPFHQGQILWLGFKPKLIPYEQAERTGGSSRWTFGKKLTYLIDGVLSYSYLPLRWMSLVGIGFALLGFLYAAIIIAFRLAGGIPVVGWAPLMVVVLVVGGIQMLMVGVLGEYLWRTLAQSRKRPLYIIDRIFD